MNLDDAFPSKYLKATDLPEDGSQEFTITDVELVTIGDKKKLVASFKGQKKGLVLNKTNAGIIGKLADSRDTDDWNGLTIHLYRAEVEFQGDLVESIRVRSKSPKGKKAKPAPAEEPPEEEESNETEEGDETEPF